MKKLLSFFIIGFAVLCYASATSFKLVSNETFSRPYDTLDQAAIAAVQESYHLSNHFEYGGMLVYNTKTGKYLFETPHTDKKIDHVLLEDDVIYANHPELKVVGDYHTHSCFPYTHWPTYFSPQDIYHYRIYNKIGYMGNFCNGEVQKWDPHNRKFLAQLTNNNSLGVNFHEVYSGIVIGEIKLNIVPDLQESILTSGPYFEPLK